MAIPLAGILGALKGALDAYTVSVQIRREQFQWQAGADRAMLEQLKAENVHLRTRLAIYEANNARPGGGSDAGQL